jgi:hypothetical protein
MLGARRCCASRNTTPSVFSVHSIRLSLPLDDDLRREDNKDGVQANRNRSVRGDLVSF